MKSAINAVHAEIKKALEGDPNKALTRRELAGFLEQLKTAILCGNETDKAKAVTAEELSALLGGLCDESILNKIVTRKDLLDRQSK